MSEVNDQAVAEKLDLLKCPAHLKAHLTSHLDLNTITGVIGVVEKWAPVLGADAAQLWQLYQDITKALGGKAPTAA